MTILLNKLLWWLGGIPPLDLIVFGCALALGGYVIGAAIINWLTSPVDPPKNLHQFPAKWHPSMSDAVDGPSEKGLR